jgi:MarR family transcriptional regulator, lower aerobic nicotinate degradation pathway regulator
MNYKLVKDLIDLVNKFEDYGSDKYSPNMEGFKNWIADTHKKNDKEREPDWEGKKTGRSAESIIASNIVHMNRFGKHYFKAALHGSAFSTPDDVIYLITLKFNPSITKMELIRKNVHEKPAGIKIINRLIMQGWIKQTASKEDKRSKVLHMTNQGLQTLDILLVKIREATEIVSGDLNSYEKMQLIRLLSKLDHFHLDIYDQDFEVGDLLEAAKAKMKTATI